MEYYLIYNMKKMNNIETHNKKRKWKRKRKKRRIKIQYTIFQISIKDKGSLFVSNYNQKLQRKINKYLLKEIIKIKTNKVINSKMKMEITCLKAATLNKEEQEMEKVVKSVKYN